MELLSGIQLEILNIRMFIIFKYIDPVKVNNFYIKGEQSVCSLSDCRQKWCWVLCPAPFFFKF